MIAIHDIAAAFAILLAFAYIAMMAFLAAESIRTVRNIFIQYINNRTMRQKDKKYNG